MYPPSPPPTDSFVDHVREVLEHLYDFPFLQNHPLAQSSGQPLRQQILQAIEQLNPGANVSFRSPPARLYNLLQLRYVEGRSIQEVGHELGLSKRQTYRDLRRAEENVAAILRQLRAPTSVESPTSETSASLTDELASREFHPGLIDIQTVLSYACHAVETLAASRSIMLDCMSTPQQTVSIYSDPVILQQVLVSILSRIVQTAASGNVRVDYHEIGDDVSLTVVYESTGDQSILDPVTLHFMEKLGWSAAADQLENGTQSLTVHIASLDSTLLVIDDNEGIADLIKRFLAGSDVRVVPAMTGMEGVQLASDIEPDAILLDVMMPHMDGWEVLQVLRSRPATAHIPVIICSVFNDSELARSLGASASISKPIKREDVIAALRKSGLPLIAG